MSLGAVDPILSPAIWDVFYVAGKPCPGIVDRTAPIKASLPFKWDEKRAPGQIGANLTFRGRDLAKFVVTLKLWRNGPPTWFANDWDDWDNWIPLLEYDSTKRNPKPVDVSYPSLQDRKIRSAVCADIIAPYWIAPTEWRAEIHMIGFLPPIPSPVITPNSASGSSSAPTAQDAQQQEIAALLKQAQQP